MKDKKIKNVFREGAISSEFIGNSIAKHQAKTSIGAHNIFLGQVRGDEIEGKVVSAIEYTAYEDMANGKFHEIREATFSKFNLTCMHIYHSLGEVKTGEICLFVFVFFLICFTSTNLTKKQQKPMLCFSSWRLAF